MIGSLRGELLVSEPNEVLIEVAGMGYRVTVGPNVSALLGEVGANVFVHIHHHIREDAQHLYGFADIGERMMFETLLSAHGVGPSLALAILSVHGPDGLRRAVIDEDVATLCLVPGVGKKTAQRLLVELSSKVEAPVGHVGGGPRCQEVRVIPAPTCATACPLLGTAMKKLLTPCARSQTRAAPRNKFALL